MHKSYREKVQKYAKENWVCPNFSNWIDLYGKIFRGVSVILKLDILVIVVIIVINGGSYGKKHISSGS